MLQKKKISDQNQIGFKISGGLVFPLLPAFFRTALDMLFVSFRFKFIIKSEVLLKIFIFSFSILFLLLLVIVSPHSYNKYLLSSVGIDLLSKFFS